MDERQLKAFRVLAEELNFSRAAARLGMTQPALSQMIARLEGECGVELFVRTKRVVALSSAGKAFDVEAERCLSQMDAARTMAQRAASGQFGKIAIGFVEAAPFSILPKLLAEIRKMLPHLHVELKEMLTAEQIEALQAGRIDLGLMRPMFQPGLFESTLLFAEPYMVAVHKEHPLAGRASVELSDLSNDSLITTPPTKRRYYDSRFRSAFARHDIALPIAHEVHQIHAVIGLVASGSGIAFVPQSVKSLQHPGVTYLALNDERPPTSELVAAWRKSVSRTPVDLVVPILDRIAARKPGSY